MWTDVWAAVPLVWSKRRLNTIDLDLSRATAYPADLEVGQLLPGPVAWTVFLKFCIFPVWSWLQIKGEWGEQSFKFERLRGSRKPSLRM